MPNDSHRQTRTEAIQYFNLWENTLHKTEFVNSLERSVPPGRTQTPQNIISNPSSERSSTSDAEYMVIFELIINSHNFDSKRDISRKFESIARYNSLQPKFNISNVGRASLDDSQAVKLKVYR